MFSADQIWSNIIKAIASEAFAAGRDRGIDEEAHCGRGIGPYVAGYPDFDEWFEKFVKEMNG